MPIKNIVGERHGRLIIVSLDHQDPKTKCAVWLCLCDCGNTTKILSTNWRRKTISCGCYRREKVRSSPNHPGLKHGMTNSAAHRAWIQMRQRCRNPKTPYYHRYGARGIDYDPRWESFENFFADMGERPDGLSLERKDNNAGYSKDNCIWADDKTQGRNTCRNKYLEYNGETKCVAEWAEIHKIDVGTLWNRLNYHWTIEQAFGLVDPPIRKLSKEQTTAIFHRSQAGESDKDLAAEFHVSTNLVGLIRRGKVFKNVVL